MYFNILSFILFLINLAFIEMVFLCQRNCSLKEYKSKVVSCKRNETRPTEYHVRMEDTIFFPTGGGQHCDKGTLGGVEVVDVYRDGDEAVHVVNKEFQVGELLDMKIDWAHRLDQTQQHTGKLRNSFLYHLHTRVDYT
jgi:Predicted metal-dependent hydrolases related to alanyl-tRNA synthetase HxxxH domain